jgi:spore maturation protein CgeB
MRVLYLGDASPSSTSRHRAEALRRIGCDVLHLNPHDALSNRLKGLEGALHYRTGYCLTRGLIASWLQSKLQRAGQFDVCWVDSGEWLGPGAIKQLKGACRKVVLFNHDDPTGPRDWARFLTLRAAISAYDLCLVVRDFNVAEFKAIGAKDVLHVWRGYDEVEHRPVDAHAPVPPAYQSDVAFIGRQMDGEGRDVLMMALINAGLKPAIWGDNWERSRHWPALQPYWRGSSLSGQNYVNALRGAKICLGMLSKGNRDLHTTRSMEIPAAGGLLCAERTSEHLALYREDVDAVFWHSAQECVEACRGLLQNAAKRDGIRAAGMARVASNKVGNQDICRSALKRLGLIHVE